MSAREQIKHVAEPPSRRPVFIVCVFAQANLNSIQHNVEPGISYHASFMSREHLAAINKPKRRESLVDSQLSDNAAPSTAGLVGPHSGTAGLPPAFHVENTARHVRPVPWCSRAP